MVRKFVVASVGLTILSACAGGSYGSGDARFGRSVSVSPELAKLAAPGQNLTRVKIDPRDGCYVYSYRGPIETTYLPLRTRAGNPICSVAQS